MSKRKASVVDLDDKEAEADVTDIEKDSRHMVHSDFVIGEYDDDLFRR
jgi:hypothetical protein